MQTILIYVFVALAVLYMGYRGYKSLKHKDHGGCDHCSPSDIKKSPLGK